MELIKGMQLDGYKGNKISGFSEHSENIILNDDYKSITTPDGFLQVGNLSLDSDFNTHTLVGKLALTDRLLLFYVIGTTPKYSALLDHDVVTGITSTIFKTSKFVWNTTTKLNIEYTYNDNRDLIVMWCDGLDVNSNRPMIFNIDNPIIDITTYGEIDNIEHLYLFNNAVFHQPTISVESVGGNLKTGTYFVSLRFKLKDTSYSKWTPISLPVVIGKVPEKYNKEAIKVIFGLSSEIKAFYKSLELALIAYNDGVYSASVFENINITTSYTIVSEPSDYVIDYESILVGDIVYNKAASIKLSNNRLHLGGVSTFNDEFNFQGYANDIVVTLDTIDDATIKGPCFAPNEIYGFNIHLIEKYTGNISKGFHIPGRLPSGSEATDCRDLTLQAYHTKTANKNITILAHEEVSRSYFKIPLKYQINHTITLIIIIDGVNYTVNLGSNSIPIFETYIGTKVLGTIYNVEFTANKLLFTTANNSAVSIAFRIEFYDTVNDEIIVADATDFPKLFDNTYRYHGYFNTNNLTVLEYWENKNELYDTDPELNMPTGKVRHHRFPELATTSVIANDTNIDPVSYKYYPKFQNIVIPSHIANKIDGFIISYMKRDGGNRTFWGYGEVNSINANIIKSTGGYGKDPIYKLAGNTFDALHPAEIEENTASDYKLSIINQEINYLKIDPKLTHIRNIGYIQGLNYIDDNHTLNRLTINKRGHITLIPTYDYSFKLYRSPNSTNDRVWPINKSVFANANSNISAIDPSAPLSELEQGYNNEYASENLYVSSSLAYTIKPGSIITPNTQSYVGIQKIPIVILLKQIDDIHLLNSNPRLNVAKYTKVENAGTYTVTYPIGDNYQGITNVYRTVHALMNSDHARNTFMIGLANYAEKASNTFTTPAGNNVYALVNINETRSIFSSIIDLRLDIPQSDLSNIVTSEQVYYKGILLAGFTMSNLYSFDFTKSIQNVFNIHLNKQNDFTVTQLQTTVNNYNTNIENAIIRSAILNDIANNVINLKSFKANDIYYMPSEFKDIVALFGDNKFLFIQQRNCLSIGSVKDVINADRGESTYVGTGDLFDRPPSKIITDSGAVISCDSSLKIMEIPYGYVIVDTDNQKVYLTTNEQAQTISDAYAKSFFKDVLSKTNITCNLGYDDIHKTIYLFVRAYGFPDEGWFDFNIGFSLLSKSWFSFYTFIPDGMLYSNNNTYSVKYGYLYKHNNNSKTLTYYRNSRADGTRVNHKSFIDIIFTIEPTITKIYETVLFETNVKDEYDNPLYDKTIDSIMVYNDNQCTGEIDISNYHGQDDWFDIITRNIDHRWSFNNLRDGVLNNKLSFLNKDKSIVPNTVNLSAKDWWAHNLISSNFIIIRFKTNNNTGNKVVMNNVAVLARKFNR